MGHSKIAEQIELSEVGSKALKLYIETVWKKNKGWFENIFSIVTYASPFLGLGWFPLVTLFFSSHILGLDLAMFGKWMDQKLGLSPGEVPTEANINEIPNLLNQAMLAKQSQTQYNISKRAGIGSAILKSESVKLIYKGIMRLIIFLAGVFGAATLSDLGHRLFGHDIETIKGLISKDTKGLISKEPAKNKKEKLLEILPKLEKKYGG